MKQLRATLIPAYLDPVPASKTLKKWFTEAGIPCLKPNPGAVRGGGEIYWSVAPVERLFRARLGLSGAGEIGGAS